jgi:hypothetical protein
MATNRLRYTFQLYDRDGKAIQSSGGVVYVAASGDAAKQAITDKDGVALSNPRALTRGACEFYVVDTAADVDLYIQAPGGQFVVKQDFVAGETPDIAVDTDHRNQVMVIPWAAADVTAATETATGFTEPANAVFLLHGAGCRVTAIDATETLDVGTLSTDSGDADGFLSALDVATLGDVLDNGALLASLGRVSGGKSITLTTTAGSDTGKGFIHLPYVLS